MKTKTMVHSKLDGIQPVYWWEKEDFQHRNTTIYDIDNPLDKTVIPIPDDCILCDFCNTNIDTFPVAVFRNSYALCPKCYNESILGLKYNEGDNYVK